MAWVKIIPENEATGRVREIYQRAGRSHAPNSTEVAEVITVFSLRPDLMEARVAFQNAMTFGGSGLGRYREELIATSISALLACRF